MHVDGVFHRVLKPVEVTEIAKGGIPSDFVVKRGDENRVTLIPVRLHPGDAIVRTDRVIVPDSDSVNHGLVVDLRYCRGVLPRCLSDDHGFVPPRCLRCLSALCFYENEVTKLSHSNVCFMCTFRTSPT